MKNSTFILKTIAILMKLQDGMDQEYACSITRKALGLLSSSKPEDQLIVPQLRVVAAETFTECLKVFDNLSEDFSQEKSWAFEKSVRLAKTEEDFEELFKRTYGGDRNEFNSTRLNYLIRNYYEKTD